MRYLLLALLFMVTSGMVAQPVFQQPVLAPLGYTADVISTDYIEPTAPSDEPQVWDFSDVSGMAISLLEVEQASLSPYFAAFDGAEWTNTVGDQVSFWSLQEGEFTIVGNANAANGLTLPFDDPLTQWVYPLEFGSVHMDTFSVEQVLFGLPYSLDGEAAIAVDAWGSIVLPDGSSIDEVLRADYLHSYVETYDGDTNTWVLNQVFYFVEDSVLPVFFHEDLTVLDVEGNQIFGITDVAWYANHLLSASELDVESASLPYPNPVKRGDELNWTLPRGWSWEAIGMDGRLLAEGHADGADRISMPTGDWDGGLVLLVARKPDGTPHGKPCRVFVH